MSLYLSRLTFNAHHNRAQSEFKYPYEFHRAISKAWENPAAARILFRQEQVNAATITVIVQSQTSPDWPRLETPREYLQEIVGPKLIELQGIKEGQQLQFRLRCRPCKRIGKRDEKDVGKRKGLNSKEEIIEWIHRKAQLGGFEIHEVAFDRVYWCDSKGGLKDKPVLGAVVFDGVLIVADSHKMREVIRNGIGTQKAFGFGLLSVALV